MAEVSAVATYAGPRSTPHGTCHTCGACQAEVLAFLQQPRVHLLRDSRQGLLIYACAATHSTPQAELLSMFGVSCPQRTRGWCTLRMFQVTLARLPCPMAPVTHVMRAEAEECGYAAAVAALPLHELSAVRWALFTSRLCTAAAT